LIFQNDCSKYICSGLTKNITLQELNMSYNNIDDEGANGIAGIIQAMSMLRRLDISHCNISDAGSILISNTYMKSNKTLKELIISWKNDQITINTKSSDLSLPGKHIGDTGAILISKFLYSKTMIKKLDISHNNIRNDGVIAISNCLKQNNTLQELNISGNCIGTKGAEKLGEVIEMNQHLLKLRVSLCTINDDSVNIICSSLTRQLNTVLQELIMAISDEGAKKIAEMIKINTTVQKLDISYCNIPDEGAVLINDVYKHSKTLQELKLSWQNDIITISSVDIFYKLSYKSIGNIGAIIISNILSKNIKTKVVDISYNSISDDGAVAIINCLRKNSTLEELNMSGNVITSKEAKMALDCVQMYCALKTFNITKQFMKPSIVKPMIY